MKTLNQLTVLLFFLLLFSFAFAQEKTDCSVVGGEVDAIYVGKCKDGLASGKGMLKYSNSKGDYMYLGDFKKGKMNGKGKLYLLEKNGNKKLLHEGVWRKSVFKGEKKEIEKSYEVKQQFNLDRYTLKKIADGNQVTLQFKQNGNTNFIENLTVEGDSGVKNSIAFDEKSSNQGYTDVEFPFTCKVNYTTFNKLRTAELDVRFEVVINEPGIWDISLNN